MKVELIDYSQNAMGDIVVAARGCFGNKKKNPTYEDDINLIRALIKHDHSPIEFAWAMFKITGISRICANQLNRYRLSSQCQTSMRYVESEGDFVHPFSCMEASDACQDVVKTCFDFYKKLIKNGVPKEDARFYLPLGTKTELTMAFNFRELRHILKQRLDAHAQWEVRQVAREILIICKDKWPWLVEDFSL